jgi:hypothetical protein
MRAAVADVVCQLLAETADLKGPDNDPYIWTLEAH